MDSGPDRQPASADLHADRHARHRMLLALALLSGLGVRLWFAQDTLFATDLSSSYELARGIAHGSYPIVGGHASWGGNVPFPGYFYLISLPFFFTDSPFAFVGWGVLLCWLGTIGFTLLLRERYGDRVAGYGALLLTTLPWSVTYSDNGEAVNLGLSIAALELYALHRVCSVERSRWAAVVPLAFTLHAHIYPNLPVMLAVGLVWWFWSRPRIAWGWLALGAALSLATVTPSLLYCATHGLAVLGRWDRQYQFSAHRELVKSVYQTFAFGTADLSYMNHLGFWWRFDFFSWIKGLPGSLGETFGWPLGGYVAANVIGTLGCWLLAAGGGARCLLRQGWRRLDPLVVSLVVGCAVSLLLIWLLRKVYMPRYNLLLLWLILLPPLLLLRGSGKLSLALRIGLLLVVLGNFLVCHHYYSARVPPRGLTSMDQVLRRIAQEQQGQPFELVTDPGGIAIAHTTIGRHRYGPQFQSVAAAAVRYQLLAPTQQAQLTELLQQPGATFWSLHRALLVRVPGKHSSSRTP